MVVLGSKGPISFRLLKQVMSQYLAQTTFSSKSHYLVQTTLVTSNKSISFMWGAYLVHKRMLMIDKQIEHVVDHRSKA